MGLRRDEKVKKPGGKSEPPTCPYSPYFPGGKGIKGGTGTWLYLLSQAWATAPKSFPLPYQPGPTCS